ncbi:hypothetical protein [Acinetobacter sp.]|uniref:hypothetical protein n=1 Tax=Acinetobacter sp. TaxID=472 RepID=UPI003D04942B
MMDILLLVLLYLGYLLLTLLGVLTHFLKKKVKGQTKADIKLYFNSHFNDTLIMVIAALVMFGSAAAASELGITSAFLIGYTADSLFNKTAEDKE